MPITSIGNPMDQFINTMDMAAQSAHQAEMLTGPTAISKRKEAIVFATEALKDYTPALHRKKLFAPQVEQFVFNFIAKNIFFLKKELGHAPYNALVGEEGLKVEIYLKEIMSLLFDYQRCISLNNRTQNLLFAFQKNPLRSHIDWQGLQQYKQNLNGIQSSFKKYKAHLNTRDFLKPLSEYVARLTANQPAAVSSNFALPSAKSSLDDPFDSLKDLYALDRVLFYLNLGLASDLPKEKELGEAVIERALQVTGEYFKSTKETPNLSLAMQKKLEAIGVPVNYISDLRDVLSHSGTFLFAVREKFREENNTEIFIRLQEDLKKIKSVVLKILYRTELKQIQNAIAEVTWDKTIPPAILMEIKDIIALQDLEKLEAKLRKLKTELQQITNTSFAEDIDKIDAILLSVQFKNERKKIANIEKINLEINSLSNEIELFERQSQLSIIDELEYFKSHGIAPSKSTITSLSETDGIKELTLVPKKIPLAMENYNLNRLYDDFIKATFKDYEGAFHQFIGKDNLPSDEVLLTLEITNVLPDKNLAKSEQQQWVNLFKFIYKLEAKKYAFLHLLKEVNYNNVKEVTVRSFLMANQLEMSQAKLLKNLLFEFHQSLMFNKIFSSYLNDFLQEIKQTLSIKKYNRLVNKIEDKKQLREAKLKLLDFIDNKFSIATQKEYNYLVNLLNIPNSNKNTIIKSGFNNKINPDVKKYIEGVPDHYTAFLNAIKKSKFASEVKTALQKLINSLDMDKYLKNSLLNKLSAIVKFLENKRLEHFFSVKMLKLKKLIDRYQDLPAASNKLKAASEMFLLDLSTIWGNLEKISDPAIKALQPETCLLNDSSFLKRINLRNYLAHGDPLFDILQPNFWEELFSKVAQFAADADSLLILKKLIEDPRMHHYLAHNILSQRQNFDEAALPSMLQGYQDAIKKYKASPRWENYLAQLKPQIPPVNQATPRNFKLALRQVFLAELREAAAKNDLPALQYFCENNLDINSKDDKNWNALFYAVAENSFAAFQELRKQKTKLTSADNAGGLLIHYAILLPPTNPSLVDALLEDEPQEINKTNKKLFTPLHLAVIKGDQAIVKKLLAKGAEIKQANRDGWTACLLASTLNHNALLHLLVDHLKSVKRYQPEHDLVNKKNGWSCLMFAALNNNLAMGRELFTLGAESASLSKSGWSALHIATFKGNQGFVRLLCEEGADVNITGKLGARPLHLAAQQGHVVIFDYLLQQASVDMQATDVEGRSFLLTAIANQQDSIVNKFFELQAGKSAVEALVNFADNRGWTPLHLAAEIGNLSIINLLIENKANLNLKNKNEATCAHLAVQQGNLEVIKLLREKGADLSLAIAGSWTNLHLSANRGHAEVVNYLLENKLVRIDAKTADGFTSLQLAAGKGHVEVIKALTLATNGNKDLIDTLSNDGQPATFLAVKNGHLAALKTLIANGADSKLIGPNGWTLLNLACYQGYGDVVDYLLSTQPDVNLNYLNNTDKSPLHLAAAAGYSLGTEKRSPEDYLKIIKTLIAKGADVLIKNNHDYVLHRAVLSDNRAIIYYVVQKIKEVLSGSNWDALFVDNEGDSPLMWAVQLKKLNSIKTLIELDCNIHYINPKGKSALDYALEEDYSALIANKNHIEQKMSLDFQLELINAVYLAHYGATNSSQLKNKLARFSGLINEEIRSHLLNASFEEIKSLQRGLKEQGPSILWPQISAAVEEKFFHEFPETQELVPATNDLLRQHRWVKLDSLTLETLYNVKKAGVFNKLQSQFFAPPSPANCGSNSQSSRRKRSSTLCENDKKFNDYEPFTQFHGEEKEAAVLVVAGANPTQRTAILNKLQSVHTIKAEGRINQSRNEGEKLARFAAILSWLTTEKVSYMQKKETPDEAQLIEISNLNGEKAYIAFHQENNKKTSQIYCPEISGYRILTLNSEHSLEEAVTLYAELLFPSELPEKLHYQYYRLRAEEFNLQQGIEQIMCEDFRADSQLLTEDPNLISGLDPLLVRQLFFFNGAVPDIAALHEDIFSDRRFEVSLRSDKLLSVLWDLPASQQIALGNSLTKYAISEAPISEQDISKGANIAIFRQELVDQLKIAAAKNKMLNREELTRLAKNHLLQELVNLNFRENEVEKIFKNTQSLPVKLTPSISNSIGITRQGLFFAPAVIQAFNGDSQGLKNMLLMMGSDVAIDQIYLRLISDKRFIEKFTHIAGALRSSARYITSPVSKILVLYSFIELTQQIQDSPYYSPEHQLAASLLIDNAVFFSVMLAEILGLELGPGSIILDAGIMLHQLIASANYLRDKLPFKVTLWDSLQLSLGFKKDWLDEKFAEHLLYGLQLRQINELSKVLKKPFSATLIHVPEVKETIHEVKFQELPKEIQTTIQKNPKEAIDNLETQYIPSAMFYHRFTSFKKPAEFKLKGFFIQASKPTVFTLNATKNLSQENSIFQRTQKVCQDISLSTGKRKKRLAAQCFKDPFSQQRQCSSKRSECHEKATVVAENWLVSASTSLAEGEEFASSSIKIEGGLAALMINKNFPEAEKKNLLVNFNSCFGNMTLVGGNFLVDTSLYVFLNNIMMNNLFDPSLHQPIAEFSLSNSPLIQQVTYLVGANFHPSKIKAEVGAVQILLLPPESERLHNIATNITTREGELYLGEIGPRFDVLGSQSLIVNFPEDGYFLSGAIQLEVLSLHFEEARSDHRNPPRFSLDPEQSLVISLREGQIDLNQSTLTLTVNTNETSLEAPRLIKEKNTLYTLLIAQPFNDLLFNNSTNLSFGEGKISVSKAASEPLTIHGKYELNNNQAQQAQLTFTNESWNLTLIEVKRLGTLLQQESFFQLIAKQGFRGISIYNSQTTESQWLGYEASLHQLSYAGINYRYDKEHGLVAIQGRIINTNPLQEDFSDAYSTVIDAISNTSLPMRTSANSVQFAQRRLTKLAPTTVFLTKPGPIPFNLLILPPQSKIQAKSTLTSSPSPLLSSKLGPKNYFLQFDGNGLLQLGLWAQGFFFRSKLLATNHPQTPSISNAEAFVLAENIVNELEIVIRTCSQKAGLAYPKIAEKISFVTLRKELSQALEVNNLEKISTIVRNASKHLASFSVGNRFYKNLQTHLSSYLDNKISQLALKLIPGSNNVS